MRTVDLLRLLLIPTIKYWLGAAFNVNPIN